MPRKSNFIPVVVIPLIAVFAALASADTADSTSNLNSFESTARLVFKTHCFHCHGEDGVVEGGLDLRLRRFIVQGGDSGGAITPSDPEDSLLFQRMVDGEMPPEEVTVRPSAEEIATVRHWIESTTSSTSIPGKLRAATYARIIGSMVSTIPRNSDGSPAFTDWTHTSVFFSASGSTGLP